MIPISVTQTWTDPSTAGAIDLATDDVLTETIYDKLLSNLKHIMGTTGMTGTPGAARGIEPASGYFMGAAAQNRHVESSNGSTGGGSTLAVTFANAFGSNPNVAATPANSQTFTVTAISTTGCTLTIGSGSTTFYWIAEGAD